MRKIFLSIIFILAFSSSVFAAECVSGDCDNGYGTYLYDDGNKYVGESKNGLWHGQGTYTFASGSEYVGEWKNNKFHGQGTYTFADGAKYVGEYKNDERNGQGTFTFPDGSIKRGIWENGELVEASEQVEVNTQQTNTDSEDSCSNIKNTTSYSYYDSSSTLAIGATQTFYVFLYLLVSAVANFCIVTKKNFR